jgi:hypothetical protein
MENYNEKHHRVNFDKLIHNPKLKEVFIKHLESEYNSEALKFYFEIIEFKKLENIEKQKEEFKIICKKFFTRESKMELNVGSSIRKKVMFYNNLNKGKSY